VSLLDTLATAWRVTRQSSRAFDAAREAYSAGQPIAGVIRAWAGATNTPVDDAIVE